MMESFSLNIIHQQIEPFAGFRLEVVHRALKSRSVNPAVFENSAFYMSAIYGHIDIFKLLISIPRVDPFDVSNRALTTRFSSC